MAIMTKLDSAVTDVNLPKFGDVKIRVTAPNNFSIYSSGSAAVNAKIIGDGNFFTDSSYSTSAGKSVTVPVGANKLFCSSGNYEIILNSKYVVEFIGPGQYLLGQYLDFGDIKDYSFAPTPRNLVFYDQTVSGDVECLRGKTTLTYVLFKGGVFGDLLSFGNSTNLSQLVIENTGLTGALEDMLDALHDAGKVSGNLSVTARGSSGVTYEGQSFGDTKHATFSSSGWTLV